MLIRGADGIFTGLPGEAMRATDSIRVAATIEDVVRRATVNGARVPRDGHHLNFPC